MKRYPIAIVAGVTAILIFVLLGSNAQRAEAPSGGISSPQSANEIVQEEAPSAEESVALPRQEADVQAGSSAESAEGAILKIGEREFALDLDAGRNAYDFMEALRSEGKLAFESRPFSGLGYFIVSIDGVRNDEIGGTYWTLYKNGKRSNVGASSLILEAGDIIEWRFERGSDNQ